MLNNLIYSSPEEIPVVFVMGPTATGKTDAAAFLSEYLPAELVSVDSSLVYRGMNIGTAKPDVDFLKKYPHHLVDIRDPDETYSAADFVADAKQLIKKITEAGKLPILVGGTSFYYAALEKGLPQLPEANAEIRAAIDEEAKQVGWQVMHDRLAELDPASAQRINVKDPQRIQRALEIIRLTGKPVQPLSQGCPEIPNPIIKVGMSFSNRKLLHERVGMRFEKMIEMGLLDEVEALMVQYPNDIPAFRMIGYRQAIDHINGDISMSEFLDRSTAATRQLAKRQLTWMRNQSDLLWWVDDESFLNKRYQTLVELISAYGVGRS